MYSISKFRAYYLKILKLLPVVWLQTTDKRIKLLLILVTTFKTAILLMACIQLYQLRGRFCVACTACMDDVKVNKVLLKIMLQVWDYNFVKN